MSLKSFTGKILQSEMGNDNEVEPVDFSQTSDEAVDELENIPYRRKNSKPF